MGWGGGITYLFLSFGRFGYPAASQPSCVPDNHDKVVGCLTLGCISDAASFDNQCASSPLEFVPKVVPQHAIVVEQYVGTESEKSVPRGIGGFDWHSSTARCLSFVPLPCWWGESIAKSQLPTVPGIEISFDSLNLGSSSEAGGGARNYSCSDNDKPET